MKHDRRLGASLPRILAVASATPATMYSQQELLHIFGLSQAKTASIFLRNGIERRALTLPPPGVDGVAEVESQQTLLAKHSSTGMDIGERALRQCVNQLGASLQDIRHLCCVTTTGLLTPGFSSLMLHRLGLRQDCARLDVVGMGCNAGVNGLSAASNWAAAHPGELAILLCIEVCSAAYVNDDEVENAVVNSLFGDGAAALALCASEGREAQGPTICKFSSQVIPEALNAMRFEWDAGHGKFRFRLEKSVPYVVGANAPTVVKRLLDGTGLRQRDISHWLVHSGGLKVIDSICTHLMLNAHDVRHTTSVLRDHGNLSSGSFLFSYLRLLEEGVVRPDDWGVMMTMGPGCSIETALLQW